MVRHLKCRSQNKPQRLLKIGETARELGEKYDVFASVMIAQAILESGSGESQQPKNLIIISLA